MYVLCLLDDLFICKVCLSVYCDVLCCEHADLRVCCVVTYDLGGIFIV